MQPAARLAQFLACVHGALVTGEKRLRAPVDDWPGWQHGNTMHLFHSDQSGGTAHVGATAHVKSKGITPDCGPAPAYKNAKPTNYADGMKTRFNVSSGKHEATQFAADDVVEYTCARGFTTDGSRDGPTTFEATCHEHGYFKTGGVCLEASKCGAAPNITHAVIMGSHRDKVEYKCAAGYSLDGEKVVPGGFGKNSAFSLKCIEFSGEFEVFNGECKAYAFVPAGETARVYNHVSKTLFELACKGALHNAFNNKTAPSGIDTLCDTFEDPAKAECTGHVAEFKAAFDAQLAAREAHDEQAKDAGKEWWDAHSADRPGIAEQADDFCSNLWEHVSLAPGL